jgi:hypothetical protein
MLYATTGCMLYAVCCMLPLAVCCMLYAICYHWLYAVCCMLPLAVCCMLYATTGCMLFATTRCMLDTVCCVLYAICYQWLYHLLPVLFAVWYWLPLAELSLAELPRVVHCMVNAVRCIRVVYTVCCMRYAVCCMLYAVCFMLPPHWLYAVYYHCSGGATTACMLCVLWLLCVVRNRLSTLTFTPTPMVYYAYPRLTYC